MDQLLEQLLHRFLAAVGRVGIKIIGEHPLIVRQCQHPLIGGGWDVVRVGGEHDSKHQVGDGNCNGVGSGDASEVAPEADIDPTR